MCFSFSSPLRCFSIDISLVLCFLLVSFMWTIGSSPRELVLVGGHSVTLRSSKYNPFVLLRKHSCCYCNLVTLILPKLNLVCVHMHMLSFIYFCICTYLILQSNSTNALLNLFLDTLSVLAVSLINKENTHAFFFLLA